MSLAAASDVTGVWKLTVNAPGEKTETVDLSLARAGGKLTGTIGQGGVSIPLQELKENGADLSFRVSNRTGQLFSIRLTRAGDTLNGTLAGADGVSGKCSGTRPQPEPPLPPLAGYLAKNSQPLDLSNLRADLVDTAGKQVFLLGDWHGLAINDDLDLALLRYFHETVGARVYVAEWGYAAGCLMNRYMETGDEHLLDFMMRESYRAVSWTKEHRAFVVKLRQWNLTLPERDRVRVVGLDIEHQTGIAAWYLRELAVAAGQAPPSIRDTAAALIRLDPEKAGDSAIQKLSGGLSAGLDRNRRDYATWLGTRFLEFDVVATNLRKRYEAYADREKSFDVIREAVMYDTFLKLQPLLAGAKCYGRWGAAHVAQRHLDNRDPFAARLNRPDSPVAGKVVTIWPLHRNCEALTRMGGAYRSHAVSDDSPLMSPLAEAARSQLTLFKLTGSGSPFTQGLYQFTTGTGGVTTDYAQYFVLIKDATPTHALEEPAAQARRPFVVRTEPASESQDVPPGVIEIKVTFSEDMDGKSFSYVNSMAGQTMKFISEPVLQPDRRTFVIKAQLDPGKVYATWLNTARHTSFRSASGEPAVPYLLVFKTGER